LNIDFLSLEQKNNELRNLFANDAEKLQDKALFYNTNDWIVFDFQRLVELSTLKIKYDNQTPRWGNVPKIIVVEIGEFEAEKDLMYKIRPNGHLELKENRAYLEEEAVDEDEALDDGLLNKLKLNLSEADEVNDDNLAEDESELQNHNKKMNLKLGKAAEDNLNKLNEEERKEVEEELEQLQAEKHEKLPRKVKSEKLTEILNVDNMLNAVWKAEKLWKRVAILETKRRAGWQEFSFDSVPTYNRRGKYVRLQFVENFGCNIEHYCKYIVQQVAFVAVVFDM